VTQAPAASPDLVASFHEHERYLWGLCYRLTGSAAEADDLVQDTFVRAMERPPARTDEPLRPWLVRVALNLGRDALRRRRRRAYDGPWLPSPVPDEDAVPSVEIPEGGGTEARYDLLESVSFAFLLALEALTPQQRAVLILRDVFDYSVKETAEALGLSEPATKTTHHRARRALAPYEATRCPPTPALAAEARASLHRFLAALTGNDVAAAEALLTADARSLSDGAGEFLAARKPIVGRAKVALAYVKLARHTPPGARTEIRTLNGLPALVAEVPAGERIAPRFVMTCTIDASGRITAVYSVLATAKLTRVRPVA
jgi:RNA polymerase sigma-70 factor (ECF subfamily)